MSRAAAMTRPPLALLLLVLAGCGGGAAPDAGKPGEEASPPQPGLARVPLEAVVARVYGQEIQGGELMDLFMTQLSGLGAHLSHGTLKTESPREMLQDAQAQFLENARFVLVGTELLARAAREADLPVDEAKLQERFLERQRRFPSDLEFRNHLAQFGATPETLRRRIATELLAEAWSARTAGEIGISDEDLRATYDRNRATFDHPTTVWVSHVARAFGVAAAEETKSAERAMIEKARTELARGVPFEDVARSYSTAPSAARGGRMYGPDIPPMMEGRVDPARVPLVVQEAVFRLGEGEVSGIVETQDSFHLIRVDKREEAGTRTFEDVKEDLRAEFVERQRGAIVEKELHRLWTEADAAGALELPSLAAYLPPAPAPAAPGEPPSGAATTNPG